MRESKTENHLHKRVTAAGGTTRKWVSPGHAGVPDRIVIWPTGYWLPKPNPRTGKVGAPIVMPSPIHFIETKAPGGKPKPHQVREHTRLRKLGCHVLVISTKEQVDNYVKSWGAR